MWRKGGGQRKQGREMGKVNRGKEKRKSEKDRERGNMLSCTWERKWRREQGKKRGREKYRGVETEREKKRARKGNSRKRGNEKWEREIKGCFTRNFMPPIKPRRIKMVCAKLWNLLVVSSANVYVSLSVSDSSEFMLDFIFRKSKSFWGSVPSDKSTKSLGRPYIA